MHVQEDVKAWECSAIEDSPMTANRETMSRRHPEPLPFVPTGNQEAILSARLQSAAKLWRARMSSRARELESFFISSSLCQGRVSACGPRSGPCSGEIWGLVLAIKHKSNVPQKTPLISNLIGNKGTEENLVGIPEFSHIACFDGGSASLLLQPSPSRKPEPLVTAVLPFALTTQAVTTKTSV